MVVEPRSASNRCGGWRVSPQKGGYRTPGRERNLLLIRRCFSHVQEQRFKDFRLKQCTEMIGGEVGVVPAKESRCHACGQE